MFRHSVFSHTSGLLLRAVNGLEIVAPSRTVWRKRAWLLMALALATRSSAVILWNDPDMTLVRENGAGTDILGGAVKRDGSADDTLYFKFHVDPLSDTNAEDYFAAVELFEGDAERLGIGNAMKAWAYSAFFPANESSQSNSLAGYIDLH